MVSMPGPQTARADRPRDFTDREVTGLTPHRLHVKLVKTISRLATEVCRRTSASMAAFFTTHENDF
jgi:hypothetical protein